jgi:hypothetical protein
MEAATGGVTEKHALPSALELLSEDALYIPLGT